MADQKYISLKVSGNPHSSSGFKPLLLFNSPKFDIKDPKYSSVDNNPYYFAINIESEQVVYKIISTKVSSLGATREGRLVIAIAIPKGYKLADQVSPSKVLEDLIASFRERCMTLKDPATQKYEFKSEIIDQKVLDDVAQKYPLVPVEAPYRPMKGSNPGYIQASAEKIRELMADVQYTEFANYSEIVVAQSVTMPSPALQGLDIPRKPQYALYIDSKFDKYISDVNEKIKVAGNGDSKYYDIQTLEFTIKKLQDKTFTSTDVSFDPANERISVSTQNLKTAKTQKVSLVFKSDNPTIKSDDEVKKDFKSNEKDWTLYYTKSNYTNQSFRLDKDLKFTLRGEEIGYLDNANKTNFQISLHKDNKKYTYASIESVEGNKITITATPVKTRNDVISTDGGKKPYDPWARGNNNKPDVYEIRCYIKDSIRPESNSYNIELLKGDELLQSTKAEFKTDNDGKRYAAAWVSANLITGEEIVRIKSELATIEYSGNLNGKKDKNTGIYMLRNDDYKPIKKFERHKKVICLFAIIMGCLLAGCALGWYFNDLHDKLSEKEKEENTELVCKKCSEKFSSQEELDKHKAEKHSTTAADDKTVTPENGGDNTGSDVNGNQGGQEPQPGFDDQNQLNTSKQQPVTPPEKTFECSTCHKKFPTKEEFKNHVATHAGQNKKKNEHQYQCDQCKYWFNTQKELDDHKWTKHGR